MCYTNMFYKCRIYFYFLELTAVVADIACVYISLQMCERQ